MPIGIKKPQLKTPLNPPVTYCSDPWGFQERPLIGTPYCREALEVPELGKNCANSFPCVRVFVSIVPHHATEDGFNPRYIGD